jgi:hypothetical protein
MLPDLHDAALVVVAGAERRDGAVELRQPIRVQLHSGGDLLNDLGRRLPVLLDLLHERHELGRVIGAGLSKEQGRRKDDMRGDARAKTFTVSAGRFGNVLRKREQVSGNNRTVPVVFTMTRSNKRVSEPREEWTLVSIQNVLLQFLGRQSVPALLQPLGESRSNLLHRIVH